MPIISRLVKGIGSGVGLASEAIADRKEKKARGVSPNPPAEHASEPSTSVYPQEKAAAEDDSDSSDDDLDNDNADWALDDAAAEIDPPPYSESSSDLASVAPMPIDEIVQSFNRDHKPDPYFQARPLPMPVIIPQRRPKDKSRGFIHAYAPMLGEYSGIDQQTFLDFLTQFHKSSQASPIFDAINVACFAVGFVPSPIAMGVTIAVQIANGTAKELQSRYRTNIFLDQINESLFKPRGLYAMIMTFKPDDPNSAVVSIDTNSTNNALYKSLSTPESTTKQKLKMIKLTSGETKGEFSIPESAPLIFPALDAAAASAQQLPEKKQNALKSSGDFIATYLDRRAQATYAATNPDSRLAVPPSEKKFASRFSDPNHPANSGTILGLLTGGNFDPKAKKRGRRAQRRASRRGNQLSEHEIKEAEMGRRPRKKPGLIKRVLQKNVLYLIIANMPSESEMREYQQQLQLDKEMSR